MKCLAIIGILVSVVANLKILNDLSRASSQIQKAVDKVSLEYEKEEAQTDNSNQSSNSNEILVKGWLRFMYTVQDPSNEQRMSPDTFRHYPDHFEINQAFYEQSISNQDEIKDEFGSINIPSPNEFFFVLTRTTLYCLLARRNDQAKTYKSLEISWLLPRINRQDYNDVQQCKGGLQDIGDFSEGYCFRLKSKTHAIWDICCKCKTEKEKWMKSIYELMASEKTIRDNGIVLPLQNSLNNMVYLNNNVKQNRSIVTDQYRNGQWVVIQDWSQCSLACGGGKSYLQRFCIPPGQFGKPCEGKRVLEKECNTMACDNIMNVFERDGQQMPTQIGIMKLSDRKNRFQMCVIKESDISIVLDRTISSDIQFLPRIPSRMVMNNQTVSLFMLGGNDYGNVYKSFDLKYLEVKDYKQDIRSCFVLVDNRDQENKKCVVCMTSIDLEADQTIESVKENWIRDIQIFQTRCRSKVRAVRVNDIENQINQKEQEYKVKLQQEKEDMKIQQIEEIENEKKQQQIDGIMEKSAKDALGQVQKEMKFEQLALQEEIMKEKMAEQEWHKQITMEQEKDNLVQKELERKARLREYEKKELEVEEKVKGIQYQAESQIRNARNKVMQKIQLMRKALERRKKQALQKIIEIRTKIATELLQESKDGNQEDCDPSQDKQKIEEYCKYNFQTELQKLGDCMSENREDFCYICCENEFGKMHQDKREKCYTMCDNYSLSNIGGGVNGQQNCQKQ